MVFFCVLICDDFITKWSKKCDNIFQYDVVAVKNRFFGETVNVAGLVTGGDLIDALRGRITGKRLFIPEVMLRHEMNVFLDDVTLEEAEAALGVPVLPVKVDGRSFAEAILGKTLEK